MMPVKTLDGLKDSVKPLTMDKVILPPQISQPGDH
jgi:hypothetical protein